MGVIMSEKMSKKEVLESKIADIMILIGFILLGLIGIFCY